MFRFNDREDLRGAGVGGRGGGRHSLRDPLSLVFPLTTFHGAAPQLPPLPDRPTPEPALEQVRSGARPALPPLPLVALVKPGTPPRPQIKLFQGRIPAALALHRWKKARGNSSNVCGLAAPRGSAFSAGPTRSHWSITSVGNASSGVVSGQS